MPAGALGLALAAACAHALWNLLLARARDPEAATAVALVLAALLFAPVAAITWDVSGRAVPYVVASAALELAYFALLAAAYARSELSLVYPLARGLAPVLVLAIAVAALGAGTSAAQVAGVLAVGAGILLVRGLSGERDAMGALLAVAVAACIAGYTLVDKDGLRYADPIPYLWLVLAPVAAGYAAAQARARGAGALRSEAGATTLVAARGDVRRLRAGAGRPAPRARRGRGGGAREQRGDRHRTGRARSARARDPGAGGGVGARRLWRRRDRFGLTPACVHSGHRG